MRRQVAWLLFFFGACGQMLLLAHLQLPEGQVGEPYVGWVQVAGGTPPYSFSLKEGRLPQGLSLDPQTGEISGIPQEAGEFPITVRVRDSGLPGLEAYARGVLVIRAP